MPSLGPMTQIPRKDANSAGCLQKTNENDFSFVFGFFVISAQGAQRDWANRAFSNVQLHKIEGDLIGWRIQLIQSEKGDFALIQSFVRPVSK